MASFMAAEEIGTRVRDRHLIACPNRDEYIIIEPLRYRFGNRQFKGETVGKLDGKVAVVTGGSTGLALAGAKLFVEEGA
jgi:hypothetical protein